MKSEKKTRSPQTGEPVLVRIQPKQLDAVDVWRAKTPGLPSRAEAIRRLVAMSLAAGFNDILEAEAAKKGKKR